MSAALLDVVLWTLLGVSDRVVLVDTRDGDPVGVVRTGDDLELLTQRTGRSYFEDLAEMNSREPEAARFQTITLPPRRER